jgi:hypothetical protein
MAFLNPQPWPTRSNLQNFANFGKSAAKKVSRLAFSLPFVGA